MEQIKHEKKIDIKTTVRKFIIDNFLFGAEPEDFSNDISFIEQGIMDSTGILELITFVETSFNIKIQDEEMLPENLDSIENIFVLIKRKKGNLGQ